MPWTSKINQKSSIQPSRLRLGLGISFTASYLHSHMYLFLLISFFTATSFCSNWFPLFVVLTYVIAPFPNMVCKRLSGGDDYFADDSIKGILETGYFLTSIFVVSGMFGSGYRSTKIIVLKSRIRIAICTQPRIHYN